MEVEQKIEKLQEITGKHLNELKASVDTMVAIFNKGQSAIEASAEFEDVSLGVHMVVQTMSLLGYFETMRDEGYDPLERL